MQSLKESVRLFLYMILGAVIGICVSITVSELYRFLNEIIPEVFPSYDIGSNKTFFDSIYTSLWFISLVVTVLITVYISLRYNNQKYERIITKTEGLYKIREVLPTYISIFGKSDVFSAITNGLIYTIPFIFVPMPFIKNESFLAKLSEPYKMMSECFGYVLAPIVMIVIIAACYTVAIPLTLKYYRAKWFSSFSEV